MDELTTTGIIDDLAYAYAGVFTPEQITQAVDEARALLEPNATIRTFLPVLVARQAREQLMATAQAEGRIAKKVPEILFVCVHNAGRSQMAAAIAEQLSARCVHVRSAGSQPIDEINPLAVQVLAERGIALTTAYPKPLTDSLVKAADVVITMGCGDACPYFPGKIYEDWDVTDPNGQPLDVVRNVRDDLMRRVTDLLSRVLD
ncbi:MAG: arsenate reductase ArsC [Propionibacterium sp.]